MQTSTKFKIAAVIAILVGPGLAFLGHKEKGRLENLDKNGTTVDGMITGGESSKRRKSSSYTFNVEYKKTDGKVAYRDFKVKSDFFKSHVSGDTISQPAVKVRYLESNPDEAVIVGGSTDDTAMFPAGIAALVLGLGALGFMKARGI